MAEVDSSVHGIERVQYLNKGCRVDKNLKTKWQTDKWQNRKKANGVDPDETALLDLHCLQKAKHNIDDIAQLQRERFTDFFFYA